MLLGTATASSSSDRLSQDISEDGAVVVASGGPSGPQPYTTPWDSTLDGERLEDRARRIRRAACDAGDDLSRQNDLGERPLPSFRRQTAGCLAIARATIERSG